jgi:hypothetical protein
MAFGTPLPLAGVPGVPDSHPACVQHPVPAGAVGGRVTVVFRVVTSVRKRKENETYGLWYRWS